MLWLEVEFLPATGFATPLRGTTLFGQCCALLARQSPPALDELLEGYTRGRPFAVLGDPRPRGHVPRPTLPMYQFQPVEGISSKEAKARRWTSTDALQLSVQEWLAHSRTDGDVAQARALGNAWRTQRVHPVARVHASGSAALRWQEETWHAPDAGLVLDLLLDRERCSQDLLLDVLRVAGREGYGAGASRGLGKFEIGRIEERAWTAASADQALLTLGHCTPVQVARTQLVNSFYRATIHHGRHGASGPGPGGPVAFAKAPVILAQPGALLCPPAGHALPFHGAGLGGVGQPLSLRDPRTVLQGYAPVLPVRFDAYVRSRQKLEAEA